MNPIKSLVKKIIFSICLVLGYQSLAIADVHQHGVTDAEYRKMILYYVNKYRLQHHLGALQMREVISQTAAKHSQDMARKALPFGHTHFNSRVKYLYGQFKECNGAAENVAYYKLNAKQLVEQWIASPGHRRNIEGAYNLTGIGIAHGKEGWAYYTQIFLRSNEGMAHSAPRKVHV